MKRILLIIFLSSSVLMIAAQTDSTSESSVSFETQLISRYVWRGIDIGGNLPFVHPCLELSLGSEKHSFTAGLWGAYAIGRSFDEEIDFYVMYSFNEMIELTVTDYFVYDGSPSGYDLFNYKQDETPHLLEAQLGFAGTEKFPFTLDFAMMIYGADAVRLNEDGSEAGLFYSKYIEFGWEKELSDESLFSIFAGASLDQANTSLGEETFYGNEKPGLINLGCNLEKNLQITGDFSCVLNISFITNPTAESAYLVAGITF
jgi:hypothetical protein